VDTDDRGIPGDWNHFCRLVTGSMESNRRQAEMMLVR
jgi:hypothetical protein